MIWKLNKLIWKVLLKVKKPKGIKIDVDIDQKYLKGRELKVHQY